MSDRVWNADCRPWLIELFFSHSVTGRPWYSDELKSNGGFNANDPRVRHVARMIAVQMGAQPSDVVDMLGALVADTGNHPLLNHLTEGTKVQLKNMLTSSSSDPDVMMNEKTAITTRVAPSFLRIGHLDLHARRVLGSNPTARAYTDEKKDNAEETRHGSTREDCETCSVS